MLSGIVRSFQSFTGLTNYIAEENGLGYRLIVYKGKVLRGMPKVLKTFPRNLGYLHIKY